MSDPNSPSGDTAREKRLARNEAFFREANELTARETDAAGVAAEFFCECSSLGCVDRVTLSGAQYEHVRAVGDRFFVVPGHEFPPFELIVETHETYLVVEKTGVAGAVAETLDPRDE